MQRKITILGGGNGARTAAAEISLLGHQVTLYEIESLVSHVAAIKEAGFIEAFGSIQGRAPINVELNLKKAVGGSELILVIVPTMYQMLTQAPNWDAADLSSLRFCTSGGAPLPVPLVQKYTAEKGVRFKQGFGMTEFGPGVFALAPEDAGEDGERGGET